MRHYFSEFDRCCWNLLFKTFLQHSFKLMTHNFVVTLSIYLITVVIWFLSGLFFQEIESKYCYQLLWKCFFLVHTRLKPEISNNNRLNWIKATIYRSCNFLYKIVYRKCYFHGPLQFYICTYTNTQKLRPMYHTYNTYIWERSPVNRADQSAWQ